jgi:quercetin dioxygenase-like cupin family protein
MPAKRIDVNQHPALKGAGAGKHERLLFNSDNYHVWIHHSISGDKGPMHRHTADQAFYGLQGECLIDFPDGTSQSITPGVMVVIPKGQYYQQEAPGYTGYVFLGSRAESYANSRFGPEGQESRPAVRRQWISERITRFGRSNRLRRVGDCVP